MTDVEAAEFADYVRDERERGGRDTGVRPGGMYRRAMMRAYAEAVGAEGELAPSPPERTAAQPPPAAMPARTAVPARAAAPGPAAAPSAVGVARRARPLPPGRDRPASAPPRALVGAAAAALAAVAAAAIWSLTPGTPPVAREQLPPPQVVRPAAPQVPRQGPAAPRTVARASAPGPRTAAVAAGPVASRAGRPRAAAADGTLSVTSQPSGARVTVNGIGWGETPVTIRHLDFGPKRIRLTLQGYVSEERVTLLSAADPSASTRFVLRRRAAPATARAPVAGAR